MKCPKCNYTSFDHNDLCPKCDRDLTVERQRLNLPSFQPAPPFLLGALVGELNAPAPEAGFEKPLALGSTETTLELNPEDSQAIEAMEEAFKDSQDLDVRLESAKEIGPESLPVGGSEEDLQGASQGEPPTEEKGEEFSLDLDDLTVEAAQEPTSPEDEKDFSPQEDQLEDTVVLAQTPEKDEGLSMDLDELSLEGPEAEGGEEPGLKVEESGPVDLEELASAVEDLVEEGGEASGLSPENTGEDFVEKTMDLEELSLEDPALRTEEELILQDEENRSVDLEELASAVEDLVDEKGPSQRTPHPLGLAEEEETDIFMGLDDLKEDDTGEVGVDLGDSKEEFENARTRKLVQAK